MTMMLRTVMKKSFLMLMIVAALVLLTGRTSAASIKSSHEITYSDEDYFYDDLDDADDDEEEVKYFTTEDGTLMFEGSDGYLYTDTTKWEKETLHMIKKAYPKQQIWADEVLDTEEEEMLDEVELSPSRSILYDDLVLLFGEEWGNDLYDGWEDEVDMEEDVNSPYYQSTIRPPSVDKYFQGMLDVMNDPDCMEGEVDMASPNFTIERAAQIWHKCHLLVIRNVFTNPEGIDVIGEFRSNVTSFIYDVNSGRVNDNGTTTFSEPMYMHDVEVNRWDMLLPERLSTNPLVLAPPLLVELLEDERVLGTAFKSLSFGVVMAENDSSGQKWHQDERPMFGDASVFHNKHGGHEHPAISIVALAPLINMTPAHGPTQFCMGSSAVNGIFTDYFDLMTWDSEDLKKEIIDLYEGYSPDSFMYTFCPTRMWRSPILDAGDMVLWDYNLNHRAGPNDSNDFRAALYTSYSRRSIQDRTFESYEDQPGNGPRLPDGSPDLYDFALRSKRKGRFALIDHYNDEMFNKATLQNLTSTKNGNGNNDDESCAVSLDGQQQCSSGTIAEETQRPRNLYPGIFSRL